MNLRLCFLLGFTAGFLECWPVALVAGLSFAVIQVLTLDKNIASIK